MEMPKRSPNAFSWNLNTIVSLLTLASVVIGGVTIWVNLNRDIDDLKKWRTSHEELHKERLAETRAVTARFDERLKVLEDTKIKRDSQVEGITIKMTSLEQNQQNTNAVIREFSTKLNDVVGDVRVAREILQRLEAGQRGR